MTGLLKVGVKNLYVFDENGESLSVAAPCVLDFYVHESRQRAGLGKEMFEHMLERENFNPRKLAIDRPSDKLIAFLKKHYGKNYGLLFLKRILLEKKIRCSLQDWSVQYHKWIILSFMMDFLIKHHHKTEVPIKLVHKRYKSAEGKFNFVINMLLIISLKLKIQLIKSNK